MNLPRVRGHRDARASLARAVRLGTLPQSILLYGPPGIGKERLGLWLAQRLLCTEPDADEPCDRCSSCRLALRLEHPDIHWFFPLSRPDASSPEKLREKLEDARAAELVVRRANPFAVPSFERPPAHFLASVLSLQRLASSRPAIGRRKVFVVGDAELMVPQESSPEAANALLKLLEEPPADTLLILTATRPGALLPTVLSRVLPVRLRPMSLDELAGLLEESGVDAEDARRLARLARGNLGRALRLRGAKGAADRPVDEHRRRAKELLDSALSRSHVPRFVAVHSTAPAGARGEFLPLLDALAEWLRDLMALAAGAPDDVLDPETPERLRRAATPRMSPLAVAAAILHVDRARALAEGNVNPQLILADLLRGLQEELST
jgi:DNA polymerase III subunit delta'